MIIKVCGLIDKVNIDAITSLDIDMIGLNFYRPSSRYLGMDKASFFESVPSKIKKVGVFVKEEMDSLREIVNEYNLDYIQLHGDEDLDYGITASELCPVIKVARIKNVKDLEDLAGHTYADYFLLDTHHASYGGSGEKFSWDILNSYSYDIPFLLSGGIAPEDAYILENLQHTQFAGVDINSRFETEAGIKDYDSVASFVKTIRAK